MNNTTHADVIIVLGAAVWKGGEPSPALRRRVLHAVKLMNEGRADFLLVTGGLGKYPPTEAKVMKRLAIAEGIPSSHIIMEDQSTTTFSSIMQCIQIIYREGWSTAIVVSDSYHITRSTLVFSCFGIKAYGSGAPGGRQVNKLWKWCYYYVREIFAIAWYVILIAREKISQRFKK